jgi:hypothetical protein
MTLLISEEELMTLTESIRKKENKLVGNDDIATAVARVIFIRWMKEHNLWQGYKKHLMNIPGYYQQAWIHPMSIVEFLGGCSFEFDKAYLPWKKYCQTYLTPLMTKCNIWRYKYIS